MKCSTTSSLFSTGKVLVPQRAQRSLYIQNQGDVKSTVGYIRVRCQFSVAGLTRVQCRVNHLVSGLFLINY